MQNLLNNLHQGGTYFSQIVIHQSELGREENVTDQKTLSVSSLHTDSLNLDSTSVSDKDSN